MSKVFNMANINSLSNEFEVLILGNNAILTYTWQMKQGIKDKCSKTLMIMPFHQFYSSIRVIAFKKFHGNAKWETIACERSVGTAWKSTNGQLYIICHYILFLNDITWYF